MLIEWTRLSENRVGYLRKYAEELYDIPAPVRINDGYLCLIPSHSDTGYRIANSSRLETISSLLTELFTFAILRMYLKVT